MKEIRPGFWRVVLVLAIAAAAGPVWAQPSLGVGAGITRNTWPDALRPENELWLTANVRIPLSSRIALEPEVGHWSGSVAPGDVQFDVRDIYVGSSALVLFRRGRVVGVVGGGGGLHTLRLWLHESRLGLHAVAGLEIPVGRLTSVFAALRREWTDYHRDSIWSTKIYGGVRVQL
jgi:hypothetical protein